MYFNVTFVITLWRWTLRPMILQYEDGRLELRFMGRRFSVKAYVRSMTTVPARKPPLQGTWAEDDLRRAFVNGSSWWEYHSTGGTMWPSDRDLCEEEAEIEYPGGHVRQ